jgi:ribosomal-protein-alanine N-acetyltransferase
MISERLQYRPVSLANLDDFHRLLQDEHVRRYLLDGNLFPREWSEARVRDSEALFARRGVGIWLAYDNTSDELVGFCGFLELPEIHPEPQLVYAIFERYSGKGLAAEMARASIAEARTRPGFDDIVAGVDEVNARSIRVLEKLGFERISSYEGSFGRACLFQLKGRRGPQTGGSVAAFPSSSAAERQDR